MAESKWLPRAVGDWREVILARVCDFKCDDSDPRYAIFSNIAYNLQYLEYLDKCMREQYLTSVIRGQLVKTFTLTASQIIECLLYIKLLELKVDRNDIWEFSRALRTAEAKNAYGLGRTFYQSELRRIKELRNKVHLQSADGIADADYAIFEGVEVLNEVKRILYLFMQKALSLPTDKMQKIFPFLLPLSSFLHTK
jgi:hypothetical protein